jgi:tRNA A37 threonylcarbamoyladenosine synthetase subunit TsaC/SUA5/YrdC
VRSPDISPAPTDEEAAAIVAAVEALWPRPTTVVLNERHGAPTWRFSGRWWQRDRLAPRERPWN